VHERNRHEKVRRCHGVWIASAATGSVLRRLPWTGLFQALGLSCLGAALNHNRSARCWRRVGRALRCVLGNVTGDW
jgi:hypothetical protein